MSLLNDAGLEKKTAATCGITKGIDNPPSIHLVVVFFFLYNKASVPAPKVFFFFFFFRVAENRVLICCFFSFTSLSHNYRAQDCK